MLPLLAALVLAPALRAEVPAERLGGIPLAVLEQVRTLAWEDGELESAAFRFGVGFDDEGFRLLVSQGGRTRSLRPQDWAQGLSLDFPAGRFAFKAAGKGKVRVQGAGGEALELAIGALLEAAYQRCPRVRFKVVDYAVVREGGSAGLPASVTLLRKDGGGILWAAYHEDPELKASQVWILAVDGIMYGLRLDGAELGFYSKPLPPIRARFETGFRPLSFQ